MIRVLLIDDPLDRDFALRMAVGTLKADANSAHAAFQQKPRCAHHIRLARRAVHADHIPLGEQAVQHGVPGFLAVKVSFMAMRDKHADSRPAQLGEDVRGDRRGPADQLYVFEKCCRVWKIELRRCLRETIEQTHGQIVRRRIHFHADHIVAAGKQTVGQRSAYVDINCPHEMFP